MNLFQEATWEQLNRILYLINAYPHFPVEFFTAWVNDREPTPIYPEHTTEWTIQYWEQEHRVWVKNGGVNWNGMPGTSP